MPRSARFWQTGHLPHDFKHFAGKAAGGPCRGAVHNEPIEVVLCLQLPAENTAENAPIN